MADGKKSAETKIIDADRQFLERHDIRSQMRDVLSKIIENRPEDPVTFLADYFETLNEKTNRIVKAHQQLTLTHYTRPAFESNARIAYDLLAQTKVAKGVKGVTGKLYNELLLTICKSFLAGVTERLMKQIEGRDHEVIKFTVFRSGVFTCLVMQDFLKQAGSLYSSLDIGKNGQADKAVCEAVIKQFTQAVGTSKDDPVSILEAGHMLGPEKLFAAVGKAFMTPNSSKAYMKKEEYLVLMTEAFLIKVPEIR